MRAQNRHSGKVNHSLYVVYYVLCYEQSKVTYNVIHALLRRRATASARATPRAATSATRRRCRRRLPGRRPPPMLLPLLGEVVVVLLPLLVQVGEVGRSSSIFDIILKCTYSALLNRRVTKSPKSDVIS